MQKVQIEMQYNTVIKIKVWIFYFLFSFLEMHLVMEREPLF